MDLAGAEVGFPSGIFPELLAQTLEFSTANVGQILARGRRGGALVEIDGNLQLAADPLAECARQRDTVFHRRAFERDERHDIRRANSRMLARVLTEVDSLRRSLDSGERCLDR